jgi:hypothetical protein
VSDAAAEDDGAITPETAMITVNHMFELLRLCLDPAT